jgi:hypothetical protein
MYKVETKQENNSCHNEGSHAPKSPRTSINNSILKSTPEHLDLVELK